MIESLLFVYLTIKSDEVSFIEKIQTYFKQYTHYYVQMKHLLLIV